MNFLHFEVAADASGSPVVLGRGAMGVTYMARDRNLDCPVALKVIAPHLVSDRITRERFLREARTAASLRHPNVATVLFLGESDGTVFYAMEFIDGRNVEEEIRAAGPMPTASVRTIGIEVTRALVAAHRAGLVHRDIKPSNILLTRRDGGIAVKLVDFGLAKLLGGEFTGATLAAASAAGFQGTPHFASPEQINGEEATMASDMYSLGATLFAMLTGRVPFEGSLAQVLSKHLSMEPPLEILPANALAFRPVLARMMAKDPASRFADPAELRAALEAITPVAVAEADPHATIGIDGPHDPDNPLAWGAGAVVAGHRLDGGLALLAHATIHRALPPGSGPPVGLIPLARPNPLGLVGGAGPCRLPVADVPGLIRCHLPEATPGVAITEWIEGPTLLQLIKSGREFQPAEVVAILRAIADAVDALAADGLPLPPLQSGDILLSPPECLRAGRLLNELEGFRPAFLPLPSASFEDPAAGVTRVAAPPTPQSPSTALASLAYELLGGLKVGFVRPPLATLTAEGNRLLAAAMDRGQPFGAREFLDQLAPCLSGRGSKPAMHGGHLPVAQASPDAWAASGNPPRRARLWPWVAGAAALIICGVGALFLAPIALRMLIVLRPVSEPATPLTVHSEVPPAPGEAIPAPPPASPPAPEPTPDPAAGAMAEASEAAAREDYAAALDALVRAADLTPDPSAALARMEMVAALLRSEAFRMTPAKFAELQGGLEAAAAREVVSARMLLGENLRTTAPSESLAWFLKAAAAGQTEAMTQAGLMLAAGVGVASPDLPAAVEWFRKGAAGGDTDAMVALAECLVDGIGTTANPAEALELLRSAAAFHHPAALVRLGRLTREGVPGILPANLDEAFRLFQAAAERGSLEGQANVGVFHVRGWCTKKDPAKAMALWKEGAGLGDPTSMLFYAQALEGGLTAKPDKAKAREFYIRAARKGSAPAKEWCRRNNISEIPAP